jgi:hypothetical protein
VRKRSAVARIEQSFGMSAPQLVRHVDRVKKVRAILAAQA